MGNAIIGIFLSAISFLQKGFSEIIEVARPLAELFGKEDAFNSIQKTIQESASILDEDAAARFSKAGDLLEPAAQKIAQRLAEAGENVKTRFSETFANTAEAIDTSGMKREFGDTVERIKAAIPPAKTGKQIGMAAAAEKSTAPAAIAGGSGQLGSFAQSMNMLFGRSANAGLLEENKRQTDWLKKIHDATKNKGNTTTPGEAVFA
jgi:hypothetical protein